MTSGISFSSAIAYQTGLYDVLKRSKIMLFIIIKKYSFSSTSYFFLSLSLNYDASEEKNVDILNTRRTYSCASAVFYIEGLNISTHSL